MTLDSYHGRPWKDPAWDAFGAGPKRLQPGKDGKPDGLLEPVVGERVGAEIIQHFVAGTVQLGYPESVVSGIGIVMLVCIVVYVIPRTSILGAVFRRPVISSGFLPTHLPQDRLFLLLRYPSFLP